MKDGYYTVHEHRSAPRTALQLFCTTSAVSPRPARGLEYGRNKTRPESKIGIFMESEGKYVSGGPNIYD